MTDGTSMNDILDTLPARLEELKTEHRDLDDVIRRLSEDAAPDMLQIQRLKKRKLMIKDQITKLESGSIPDIIA
ncbi:YdcH family protein [Magnetovibrio sp. PR-2]